MCVLQQKRKRRGLSESTGFTHHVSDEILQRASLDKLSYQIELLVLVEHTNEPQNMGMVQAPHDFDLQIRSERDKGREREKRNNTSVNTSPQR